MCMLHCIYLHVHVPLHYNTVCLGCSLIMYTCMSCSPPFFLSLSISNSPPLPSLHLSTRHQNRVQDVFRFTTFCVQLLLYLLQLAVVLIPEPQPRGELPDPDAVRHTHTHTHTHAHTHTHTHTHTERRTHAHTHTVSLSLSHSREDVVQRRTLHFSPGSRGGG